MSDKNYTIIQSMKKVSEFLSYHGLDHLGFDFGSTYKFDKTPTLTIYQYNVTKEQDTKLKLLFGPLKVEGSDDSKYHTGHYKFDDALVLKLTYYQKLSCEKLTTDQLSEWTEEQWQEHIAAAKEGTISVTKCTANEEYREDPDSDSSY